MTKRQFLWAMGAGVGALFLLVWVIDYSFFRKSTPDPSEAAASFDRLFVSISDDEELWKAFQARIESPGPDEDLGAIFASFWARSREIGGESFGDGVRRRWTKLARASKDLRVRDLFLAYEEGADRMDGFCCGFDLQSSQIRVGDPLPFVIWGDSVRLQRRRMAFSEDWSLQATDQVDTIDLVWKCFDTTMYARMMSRKHGCDGNFGVSKPMEPGIWRFTLLSDDAFREVYLNVTENDVAVEMDHKGFLLWAGADASVRLWNDKDTIVRTIGPEGFLRLGIDPPASGRMEYDMAVRQGRSVYFRKLSWMDPDPKSAVRAVAWADRSEYRPGDTVRFHGILREFDADGQRSVPDLPGPLRMMLTGNPFYRGLSQNLTKLADGQFEGDIEIPMDAHEGSAMGLLAVMVDGALATDSGSRFDTGWRTLAERGEFVHFEVRKEPRPNVASIHSSWDKAYCREGDTAFLRVQVLDKDRKPWSGKVGLECRWVGGSQRSELSTDRHGMVQWSVHGLRKGAIRATVVAEVGDSILEGGSEAEAVSDREVLPRMASLDVRVAENRQKAGELEVRVESPHENSPVMVLLRGRRLGEARQGRLVDGRFVAILPRRDLGWGSTIEVRVKGPANVDSRSVRVPEMGESRARVVSRLRKVGREWTASFDVVDTRGNGLASRLTVAVVGSPSQAPGFDSIAGWSGGGGTQILEREFPYRDFLYRGVWAGKFASWYDGHWTGADRPLGFRSRSDEPIVNSVVVRDPDKPTEIRFDPHQPWKEGDRFGPSSCETSPACGRMAYWNGSVETSATGKAQVRFEVPPGNQEWYLVIRGTAGKHLLVSHIVKI